VCESRRHCVRWLFIDERKRHLKQMHLNDGLKHWKKGKETNMKGDRVKHILAKKCDEDYAKTLCGRIIRRIGFFVTPQHRAASGYLEFSDSVDCQDCLRKHFTRSKQNG
jgi:hypothetical protein